MHDTVILNNMREEMEHILSSKFISYWGIMTAGLITVDTSWLNNQIVDTLEINPFFTNLYMGLFGIYYTIRIYWYWEDKSLDKKERTKKLKKD